MNVVIVESPAKAKTISKYLGKGYEVYASYGHVRDLPPKDGALDPDGDFAMLWDVDSKSAKRLAEIAKAVKGASRISLAADPDREGDALYWHVLQALTSRTDPRGDARGAGRIHRGPQTRDPRGHQSSARDRRRARRCLSRPPRARLSRRVQSFAGAMAQIAWRPLGWTGAIRRLAPGLRPRTRDRKIRVARILVHCSAFEDQDRGAFRCPARGGRWPADRPPRHRLGGGSGSLQGGPRRGQILGGRDRSQARHAASAAAVHDLDTPAGSLPQARLCACPDHAARPTAL